MHLSDPSIPASKRFALLSGLELQRLCPRGTLNFPFEERAEICLVLCGSGRLCSDHWEAPIEGGMLALWGHRSASLRDPCQLEIMRLRYDPRKMASCFYSAGLSRRATEISRDATLPVLRLAHDDFDYLRREMEEMLAESERDKPSISLIGSCLCKILLRLQRLWVDDRSCLAVHPTSSPATARALSVIDRAVLAGDGLSISSLAAEAGVSVSHFSRLVRSALGISAKTYLQRRRIELASRRLLLGGESATELAYSLGFADSAHFCRLFKRTTGYTPKAFQRFHAMD